MLRHRVGREQGQEIADLLQSFIGPLEQWLDRQIDRRLVRTFFLALVAIVRLRNSRSGLLLSELGAHILCPAQAPAGTKRLSNLLCSAKWSHTLLDKFLRRRAQQSLSHLEQQDELALAVPRPASVLFVGDADQLPSVGPGKFLGDLLESGVVPFLRLERIFRQGTGAASSRRPTGSTRAACPLLAPPAPRGTSTSSRPKTRRRRPTPSSAYVRSGSRRGSDCAP